MLFVDMGEPEDQIEGSDKLAALSASLSRHDQALQELKGVPAMLQIMASQMGVVLNAPLADSPIQSNPNVIPPEGQDIPLTDADLLNIFRIDLPKESETVGEDMAEELQSALSDCEKSLEMGPEIGNSVADAYNRTVKRPLSKETVTQLYAKYKIPRNCKSLIVPKVNPEIWGHLPNRAKIGDLGLQSVQQCMGFALNTLAITSNMIAKFSAEKQITPAAASQLLQLCMDSGNVLGNGFQSVTTKRKMEIKPQLHPDYAGICSNENPVTEYLFGSDLKEALKTSKAASMVMKQTFSKYSTRFKPYEQRRYRPSGAFQSTSNPLNRQRPSWGSQRRRGGWNQQRSQYGSAPNPQYQQQHRRQ